MVRSRGSQYRPKESGSSCSDAFSTAASSSSAPQGAYDASLADARRPDRRALRERLREERAADEQDVWGAWQKPKAESSNGGRGRWKGTSSEQHAESWDNWDEWKDWPAESKTEKFRGERRRRWKGPLAHGQDQGYEEEAAPSSGSWDKWKGVSAVERSDDAAETQGSWANWRGVTSDDAMAGMDADPAASSGSWAKWKGVAAGEFVADLEKAMSGRSRRGQRRRRRKRGPRRQGRFHWTQVGVEMAKSGGLDKMLGFPIAGDSVTTEQLALASRHGLKVPVLLELGAMIKRAWDDDAGDQDAEYCQYDDDDDEDGQEENEQDDEVSEDDLDHKELGSGYWLGVGYNNDGGDSDEELGHSDSSSERAPRPDRYDGLSMKPLVLMHNRQDEAPEDLDPEEAIEIPHRKPLLQARLHSELELDQEPPAPVRLPLSHEPLVQRGEPERPNAGSFHVPSPENAYGNVAPVAHPWPAAGSMVDANSRLLPAPVRGPPPASAAAVMPMRGAGLLPSATKPAEGPKPWSKGGVSAPWREDFSVSSSWSAASSSAAAAVPAASPVGGMPLRNLQDIAPQRAPNTFSSCAAQAPPESAPADLSWSAALVGGNPVPAHLDQSILSRAGTWSSAPNAQLAPRRDPWPMAPHDAWPAPRREPWPAGAPDQGAALAPATAAAATVAPLLVPSNESVFGRGLPAPSAWPSDASTRVSQAVAGLRLQADSPSWETSLQCGDACARVPRTMAQHGAPSFESSSRCAGAGARFPLAAQQHVAAPWEAVLATHEQSMSSTAPPLRAERVPDTQGAILQLRAMRNSQPQGMATLGSQTGPSVQEQFFLPSELAIMDDSDDAEPEDAPPGANEEPYGHLAEFEWWRRNPHLAEAWRRNAHINGISVVRSLMVNQNPWMPSVVALAEQPQCWLHVRDTNAADREASPEPWYNREFLLLRRPEMGFQSKKRSRRRKRREKAVIATMPRPYSGIGNLPQAKSEDCYGLVADLTPQSIGIQIARPGGEWSDATKSSWSAPDYVSFHSLQVADISVDQNTGVVDLVWRLHCVGLKSLPQLGHSKVEPNHLHIQGETGILNRPCMHNGILEVHMQTARGRKLQVQAGCFRSGSGDRCVQRLILTDMISLCVDHRRPSDGLMCLCPEAIADAVDAPGVPAISQVSEWESTADYMAAWKPLLELEAATCAVDECDSRLLFDMEITWEQTEDGSVMGSFEFDTTLAYAHRLRLRNVYSGQDGAAEWASGWLCLRRVGTGAGTAHESWSGHAAIVRCYFLAREGVGDYVSLVEDDWTFSRDFSSSETRMYVVFRLTVPASDLAPLAEQQANAGKPLRGYVAEFIPKPLSHTYQARALSELESSSKLLREVVLCGRSLAKPAAPAQWETPAQEDSAAESFASSQVEAPLRITEELASLRLDSSQEAAVSSALEEPFSLIHGQPGTGKTRTAGTLAMLFALRNARAGSPAAVLYSVPHDEAADAACLQVNEVAAEHFERLSDIHVSEATGGEECVICLNGACDVITRCGHMFHAHCLSQALEVRKAGCPLCRQPLRQLGEKLSTLRVYSNDIEQIDFPVPRRIVQHCIRQRKLRATPECLRKHSLHWRCHAMAPDVVPTEEAKKARQAYQQLCQADPGDSAFDKYFSEYYSALREAWAAEVQRADIIFATCITSCRAALAFAFGEESDGSTPVIKQVILDDAGQPTESEALCPLTRAKGVERVVLVGDPKQFQPRVQAQRARELGLGVSLFQRLSALSHARPRFLTVQHRMHPDIDAFPSTYFYNGGNCTNAVDERPLNLLEHPQHPNESTALLFWASKDSPGEQIVQVHTTENAGAWRYTQSRFNEPEARLASKIAYDLAARVGSNKVAVLCWYTAQVTRISGLLHGSGIYVGMAVSAQGNEWDYVVLSTVRSAPDRLGSRAEEQQLQLALTRARCGLLVLGHLETLRGVPAWKAFLEHCEERGVVTAAEPRLVQGTSLL